MVHGHKGRIYKLMLLEVRDLQLTFNTRAGVSTPVDGVSYTLEAGETLGIVGESGCGKSLSSLSILRLVPPPGRITRGEILLEGEDLVKKSSREMRKLRGRTISMILQDPVASLNPVFSIGNQVGEAVTRNRPLRSNRLVARVVELLRMLRIPSAEDRIYDYPHQMSGGMRQRVGGAIALAGDELKLVIADEPTTALDVTVQKQYLDLLKDLQSNLKFGLIFISHDIGVVAEVCDRIAVMYAGKIVEMGRTFDVIDNPRHPYTQALLQCLPRLGRVEYLEPIAGEPPDPVAFPSGCRFAPRCPKATDLCVEKYPDEVAVTEDHFAACWYVDK